MANSIMEFEILGIPSISNLAIEGTQSLFQFRRNPQTNENQQGVVIVNIRRTHTFVCAIQPKINREIEIEEETARKKSTVNKGDNRSYSTDTHTSIVCADGLECVRSRVRSMRVLTSIISSSNIRGSKNQHHRCSLPPPLPTYGELCVCIVQWVSLR
ncbi:hypothetical protein L2E82_25412 [Cichorium intybus]|uniref:Uncharacterized protein n=1 Tax=Cichorium intybus TaxID=13427 RepID=A0ACB9E3E7_CICIN|nr:hypothetical protein L2E82_25412 [Cichorium intybus]